MPGIIARYAILFVLLVFVQVLVCNNIILFGLAVPLVFIYFILRLPSQLNVKWVLTLSFLLGFAVDIFSDTPGVNALSCTVLAYLRLPLLRLYSGSDELLARIIPSIASLGIAVYAKYMVTFTLLYCTLCFSLEYFTFTYLGRMTLKILASTAFTSLLLLGLDALMRGQKE